MKTSSVLGLAVAIVVIAAGAYSVLHPQSPITLKPEMMLGKQPKPITEESAMGQTGAIPKATEQGAPSTPVPTAEMNAAQPAATPTPTANAPQPAAGNPTPTANAPQPAAGNNPTPAANAPQPAAGNATPDVNAPAVSNPAPVAPAQDSQNNQPAHQ